MKKIERPVDVSTAFQARGAIAQPTRRPRFVTSHIIKTQHGEAVVSGRLGQQHLDFIECARRVAIEAGIDGVGRFCCVVDPYQLRKALSAGRHPVCWGYIKELAMDLRQCEISRLKIYSRPGFGVVTAGILDAVVYRGVGKIAGRNIHGSQQAERELWLIPFSIAWTELIEKDTPISYRDQLPALVALSHGVSQAVGRFMLSHKPGTARYTLAGVLDAVGAGDTSTRRHRLKELLADAPQLAGAGIKIDVEKGTISS